MRLRELGIIISKKGGGEQEILADRFKEKDFLEIKTRIRSIKKGGER